MPSQANSQQVAVLQEKLEQAKSVAIVDYTGTTGNDQVKLRQSLKDAGAEILVTKNTLIDIAIGRGQLASDLEGMNAIVFSYQDEVSGIKALYKFHKDEEKLEIKGGLLDGKVMSAAEIKALSNLPGKDELIATLISRLNGPGTGLVNVLQANTRDLVQVLRAISEKE